MAGDLKSILEQLTADLQDQKVIKITLGNRRLKSAELKNVFIKPTLIKNNLKLSFNYRYPTRDITKNFDIGESVILIEKLLLDDFFNADIFTAEKDIHVAFQKNNTVKISRNSPSLQLSSKTTQHDREKKRLIDTAGNTYLKALGICTADGVVKKDKQDKYKQINHYIEIIDGIIKDLSFGDTLEVTDMGSGKGYLTFALYDYLMNKLQLKATVTGIELREELVKTCNDIAQNCGYNGLAFKSGAIGEATLLNNTDILIALHACDTATDEAIYSGIKANAKVIICAPCCHKQIRKQMAPVNELKSITKHGILLERQAEIATDAIRALLLEAYGYKTRVFDFIATEHTPKNVLIVGIRQEKQATSTAVFFEKVAALKALFSLDSHHLETLLDKLNR